jgi:hypothetical protein
VDISFHILRNSQILNQELQDLPLFHGTEAIVQLLAAVIPKTHIKLPNLLKLMKPPKPPDP